MKQTFFEYYSLPEERIKEIWDNGLIVVDANVLLEPYKCSKKSREELMKILEFYNSRLWLPYQVGLEYQQNRESTCRNIEDSQDNIQSTLDETFTSFINSPCVKNYNRHPNIQIDWVLRQLSTCKETIFDYLVKKKKALKDDWDKNEIHQKLSTLFDGKVGLDFEYGKLKDIYKEGLDRYKEQVPPGYGDMKNKKNAGDRHIYGDLILWKQIIHKAKEKKCDVIFITKDTKEDWFEIVRGEKKGPRKELLREFREHTQKDILIYTLQRFLKYAKDKLPVAISQETITETADIKKQDFPYEIFRVLDKDYLHRQDFSRFDTSLFTTGTPEYWSIRDFHRDPNHYALKDYLESNSLENIYILSQKHKIPLTAILRLTRVFGISELQNMPTEELLKHLSPIEMHELYGMAKLSKEELPKDISQFKMPEYCSVAKLSKEELPKDISQFKMPEYCSVAKLSKEELPKCFAQDSEAEQE